MVGWCLSGWLGEVLAVLALTNQVRSQLIMFFILWFILRQVIKSCSQPLGNLDIEDRNLVLTSGCPKPSWPTQLITVPLESKINYVLVTILLFIKGPHYAVGILWLIRGQCRELLDLLFVQNPLPGLKRFHGVIRLQRSTLSTQYSI